MANSEYQETPSAAQVSAFIAFLNKRGGIQWTVPLNYVEHEIAMAAHAKGMVRLSRDGDAFFLPDRSEAEVEACLADLKKRLEPHAVARFIGDHDKNLN